MFAVVPDDRDNVVFPVQFQDEAELLTSLQARDPGATAAFYNRYAKHVIRVLARVLGQDQELDDLLHEVFVRAIEGVDKVREADRLKAWLTSIAVFTARGAIRYRTRRRWLGYRAPENIPDVAGNLGDPEASDALRRTYAILDGMPADQRIPFSLRVIDGMPLNDVAEACGVSLATIKRRLQRAEYTFVRQAQRDPILASWVDRHPRWRDL